MFNQLPMYQQKGVSAYKEDLTNTINFCKHLNNPERSVTCIHVAGTNGKGSVSHMLSSVLQEAGYQVGLYTSPHLIDFKERIKINNTEVEEAYVVQFISENESFFKENSLSFFEMTVGLAFSYFKQKHVDIAVIEVGLGGRLDSTNIISPIVSVITTIGLDHTLILGNTLAKIANEKAGIIKSNTPVVVGAYDLETKDVFIAKAKAENAQLYFADDIIHEVFTSDLKGNYQQANIKTVQQTIQVIRENKILEITTDNLKTGLLNVVKNTGLMGRWQQISQNPKVVCDTAHNEQGLKIVMEQLKSETYSNLYIVLGFVNDKDLDQILPLFPTDATYFFAQPYIERRLEAAVLAEKSKKYNLNGNVFESVKDAYNQAVAQSKPNDFIYVGGSTFVVGDFLSFISCQE